MRSRHSGWTNEDGNVVTACTIDSGDEGDTQTSVVFRSSEDYTDLLTIIRPYPQSTVSEYDTCKSIKW